YPQATAFLDEVEILMRKNLPPTHYAFASLAASRAAVAKAQGNLPLALQLSNQAVEISEAALKARGEGAFAYPGFLLNRSSIYLAAGNAEQAAQDANTALKFLQSTIKPNTFSTKLGNAYFALGRALEAEGKQQDARAAGKAAADQYEQTLGKDNP